MPLSSKAHIVAIPKNFLMGSLLWGNREFGIAQARCQWTEAGQFPDYCRTDKSMKYNDLAGQQRNGIATPRTKFYSGAQ
jgi:hypothetical protein